MKITVEYIITDSELCWETGNPTSITCNYFDNEGGHGYCTLFDESIGPDALNWEAKNVPCQQCLDARKDKCFLCDEKFNI